MAKEEGATTVVVGGRNDVQQEYCGTVGGESTDYSTIDTEIKVISQYLICQSLYLPRLLKTTHLKDNPLAPPNLYAL